MTVCWKESSPIPSLIEISYTSSCNLQYVFPILSSSRFGLILICLQQELNPRFLRKWGCHGQAPGQFVVPRALAVHPDMDFVCLIDSKNNQIHNFLRDGTLIKRWGSEGPANGQFWHPMGVALHSTLNWIIVSDTFNHRIQVFDLNGTFIRKWGSQGTGDGQFRYPLGVAVFAWPQNRDHPTQDLIYVADNNRVQVFTMEGVFIRTWNTKDRSDGQIGSPCGVAVHPTRDIVFISDSSEHNIQAFRRDGSFLFKWGSEGSANGQSMFPGYLSIHPTRDLLFVADSYNHRVHVFNLDGSFVCNYGSKGQGHGEFTGPIGVALHPSTETVYVSDDHSIQAFSLFPTGQKNKRKNCLYTSSQKITSKTENDNFSCVFHLAIFHSP